MIWLVAGGTRPVSSVRTRVWGAAFNTRSVTTTSSRWKLLRTAREGPNSRTAAETISRVEARSSNFCSARWMIGAGDGIRTRDIDLGKVALYQLSYSRLKRILHFPLRAGRLSNLHRNRHWLNLNVK